MYIIILRSIFLILVPKKHTIILKLIEHVYKSKIRKKFAEANNIELSVRGQTTNRVLLQVQTAKS